MTLFPDAKAGVKRGAILLSGGGVQQSLLLRICWLNRAKKEPYRNVSYRFVDELIPLFVIP